MTKFSNKFKKLCFWPILGPFSQFFGEKKFPRKSGSVTRNFIWVSSTMPKFRKVNDTIQRKRPDKRKDGPLRYKRESLSRVGVPSFFIINNRIEIIFLAANQIKREISAEPCYKILNGPPIILFRLQSL